MIFTATLLKRWRTDISKQNCCMQSMGSTHSFWAGMRSGSCCLTTCLQASSNLTSRYEKHRLAIVFRSFKVHPATNPSYPSTDPFACTWLMHDQCNRRTMQNASFTVADYITPRTCVCVHMCPHQRMTQQQVRQSNQNTLGAEHTSPFCNQVMCAI
jgi:hypothetical protein